MTPARVTAFEFPSERDSSADRLLDIWRYQNDLIAKGRPDRVEILAFQRRFFPPVRGTGGLAYVRFRPLDMTGSAAGWDRANCAGETIAGSGVQITFYWDEPGRRWLVQNTTGSVLCATAKDLSQAQIDEALTIAEYPKPPQVAAGDVVKPLPGSPERKAILDAMRAQLGPDGDRIRFKVRTMKVAAGFAWVVAMPVDKIGKRIGCIEGDDLQAEMWLKQEQGRWTVVRGSACSGDPAAPLGETIGAPPQLIGQNMWPWAP